MILFRIASTQILTSQRNITLHAAHSPKVVQPPQPTKLHPKLLPPASTLQECHPGVDELCRCWRLVEVLMWFQPITVIEALWTTMRRDQSLKASATGDMSMGQKHTRDHILWECGKIPLDKASVWSFFLFFVINAPWGDLLRRLFVRDGRSQMFLFSCLFVIFIIKISVRSLH